MTDASESHSFHPPCAMYRLGQILDILNPSKHRDENQSKARAVETLRRLCDALKIDVDDLHLQHAAPEGPEAQPELPAVEDRGAGTRATASIEDADARKLLIRLVRELSVRQDRRRLT